MDIIIKDILKDMNSKSSQFQEGFMLGFGYSIAVGLTISTTVLVCYVYDTVQMHMNDVKELKEKIDGKEKETLDNKE